MGIDEPDEPGEHVVEFLHGELDLMTERPDPLGVEAELLVVGWKGRRPVTMQRRGNVVGEELTKSGVVAESCFMKTSKASTA